MRISPTTLLAVAASAFTLAVTGPGAPAVAAAGCVRPLVVAHRGSGTGPIENSIASVSSAVKSTAQWIEFDVRASRDGVPFLLHDTTLDRTTTGTGVASDLSWSKLSSMRIKGDGEPLPLLTSYLRRVAQTKLSLLLEIKTPMSTAQVQRVVRVIYRAGLATRTVVHSFSERALTVTRNYSLALHPRQPLRTGLLSVTGDLHPVRLARQLHVSLYEPPFAWVEQHPRRMEWLRAAHISVLTWTPDATSQWQMLLGQHVTGIITDYPLQLMQTEHSTC